MGPYSRVELLKSFIKPLISKPFITNNLFLGRLKISASDFIRDYVRKGLGSK